MSAGKCKRVAASCSSGSDDDSPCSDDTSPTTTAHTEPLLPALNTDHDYDVSSPGSSSTHSGGGGPSDMRLPGFTHHSHDTPRRPRVKKKKGEMNIEKDVCSHADQPTGQLACSRLAKPQQLTPRTKASRGTQPLSCLLAHYFTLCKANQGAVGDGRLCPQCRAPNNVV